MCLCYLLGCLGMDGLHVESEVVPESFDDFVLLFDLSLEG